MSVRVYNTTTNPGTPATNKLYTWANSVTKRLWYTDDQGNSAQVGGLETWYNVKDYGLKGDDSTDNLSAINTMLSGLAAGSIIYFPAGTFRFSGAINPGAKFFRFVGAGYFTSVVKTTSATADLFALTDSNWYSTWEDLQFTTSVNKTAGSMINTGTASGGGNVSTHVRRCVFTAAGSGTYIFNGIAFNGTQAANQTFVEDCFMTNFSNFGIALVCNTTSNLTFASLVLCNVVMNGTLASGNAAACVQVTQTGALQIDNCDFIGAVNNMLCNPATGSPVQGVFSLYATNTYFDAAAGSCIKLSSTGNIERCKFVSCSFTTGTGSGFTAFEVSSTASILPTAIDILNCNILNTFGTTGTTNGINATGFTDINVLGNNIAGWTNGIQTTPSTPNGGTKVYIRGNTIGPVGNIAGNGTGILLNAGSFTYGQVYIDGNTLTGNTTAPITDNSTVILGGQKFILNNIGLPIGNAIANRQTLAAANTYVMGLPLPVSSLRVGSHFRATLNFSNPATASTTTLTVKWGTAGTTGDGTIHTSTYTGTAVADVAKVILDIHVDTLNAATGTVTVHAMMIHNLGTGATGFNNAAGTPMTTTQTTTLNTTTALNILGIAVQESAATTVLLNGTLETIN
jgi:hypothetical protein